MPEKLFNRSGAAGPSGDTGSSGKVGPSGGNGSHGGTGGTGLFGKGGASPARMIVMLAFFTALYIVLERFLSVNVWNMRIGFAFIALAVSGILYGPVAAGLVGAAGDIIGMMLFPTGPFFPGFTLNAFLTGAVFGLFLHKGMTVKRMAGAVAVNQLVLSLFVQTLWISITYGAPYAGLLPVRLTQCLVMIPVQLLSLYVIGKPLAGAVRRTTMNTL